jgi:ribokinase
MVKRLCVVGSINLDLVFRVAELPGRGETVLARSVHRFGGGKGANQALAARKLGAEVALVGIVGRDAAAGEALALLRQHGVTLAGVAEHDELPTGTAVITVADDAANHILVAPGANAALRPDTLALDAVDAVICQLEIPGEVVARAAELTRGFLCLNLAPAGPVAAAALRRADLVIVNEVEAGQLGETLHEVRGLLAITLGERGAVLLRGGHELARVIAPTVNAVDTTGAGDAFVAALTVGLVEAMAPADALRFACAAGAVAVTRAGAQPSLPTRVEVEALLRGG